MGSRKEHFVPPLFNLGIDSSIRAALEYKRISKSASASADIIATVASSTRMLVPISYATARIGMSNIFSDFTAYAPVICDAPQPTLEH